MLIYRECRSLKNPQKYQQDDNQYDDYQDCNGLVQGTLTSFTKGTLPSLSVLCTLSCTHLDANNVSIVTLPNPAGRAYN